MQVCGWCGIKLLEFSLWYPYESQEYGNHERKSHGFLVFFSPLDVTILIVINDQSIKAKGLDRVNIQLPRQQLLLITKVAKASNGNMIMIIMSTGRFDISFAKNDNKIPSILWFGYPGLSFKVYFILDLWIIISTKLK